MSTIAKVMVVVILVLSVAFAVVSGQLFAKREKLRADYTELKDRTEKELSALKQDKTQLEADRAALQAEIEKAKAEIGRQETDNRNLKSKAEEQAKRISDQDALLGSITTTIEQLNTNLKNKDERLTAAEQTLGQTRDQLRQAQELARQKELEAKKSAQEAKEATDKVKELEVALKDRETKLELLKAGGGKAGPGEMVQAAVDALVIKVDSNANLVVINKGREQGVEVGYVFTVYRGNAYLGDLRIENVAANVAAGSPVAGTMVGNMREGDNASTRIR